jgi:hypothetical protein
MSSKMFFNASFWRRFLFFSPLLLLKTIGTTFIVVVELFGVISSVDSHKSIYHSYIIIIIIITIMRYSILSLFVVFGGVAAVVCFVPIRFDLFVVSVEFVGRHVGLGRETCPEKKRSSIPGTAVFSAKKCRSRCYFSLFE